MRRELVWSLSGRAAKSPGPRVCRLAGRAKLFLSIKFRKAFEITLMIKVFFALATAAWAVLSITTMAATAEQTVVVAGNDVSRIATLRNVSIKNGEVSGELVNNSSDTLRDVVVEIRYTWLWTDEFHPGKDDPGRTVYYTAAKEIPPGGSARFEYKPSPPLPERRDGSFVIDVKVAGFERVYR